MHLFEQKVIQVNLIDKADRAREEFGDVSDLAASQEEVGLITPIAVRDLSNGRYQLLAGERRLMSFEQQGEASIPACVFPADITPRQQKLIELFENAKRKDFTPAENAKLTADIHNLMVSEHGESTPGHTGTGWRQKDTAEFLGISIPKVSQDLEIAYAVDKIPELKGAKTRKELVNKINRIVKHVVRDKASVEQLAKLDGEVKTRKQKLIESYIIVDFFEEVLKVPDESQKFIECDTPYGIGLDETRTTLSDSYEEWPADKFPALINVVAHELYRVAAPNSWLIMWHDPFWEFTIKEVLEDAGWTVRRTRLFWVKNFVKNASPEYNLSNYVEQAYVCAKGSPRLVKESRSNLFTFDCVPTNMKIHDTERPIALIEEIINTFTLPNVDVFVPFLGSGKTLLAAANLKRLGFGFDKSAKHKASFSTLVGNQIHGMYTDQEE